MKISKLSKESVSESKSKSESESKSESKCKSESKAKSESESESESVSKPKEPISKELIISSLIKNIKINYIFYIVILICLYILSKCKNNTKSFLNTIITFIFISFFGYFIHYVSHNILITNLYDEFDCLLKFYPRLHAIIIYNFGFLDFHATTHHNSNINTKFKNILFEFINNLFTQGFVLIILLKFLQYIDMRIVIIWAFLYATVHNINFSFTKPTTHRDHHLNCHTNYGLDVYDILFGTKYDWNDLENYNHGAINMIILTAITYYFTK